MRALEATIEPIGAAALALVDEVGGIALLAWRVLRRARPVQLDARELVRNLYKMGNRSVPIVVLTAFFAGGMMVLQTGRS